MKIVYTAGKNTTLSTAQNAIRASKGFNHTVPVKLVVVSGLHSEKLSVIPLDDESGELLTYLPEKQSSDASELIAYIQAR